MTKRKFLFTLALGLTLNAPALQNSFEFEKIIKILKDNKFKTCKVKYSVIFADKQIENSVSFLPNDDYESILGEIENRHGFNEWIGLNLDNELIVIV